MLFISVAIVEEDREVKGTEFALIAVETINIKHLVIGLDLLIRSYLKQGSLLLFLGLTHLAY